MEDQEQEVELAVLAERLKSTNEKLDTMIEKMEAWEKRLSSLERWRAALIGGGAVAGALASRAWDLLTK